MSPETVEALRRVEMQVASLKARLARPAEQDLATPEDVEAARKDWLQVFEAWRAAQVAAVHRVERLCLALALLALTEAVGLGWALLR